MSVSSAPDADELAAWLRLLATPGVGRDTARRLLAAFGSPQAVLAAGELPCRSVAGVAVGAALAQVPAGLATQVAAVQAWLQGAGANGPARRVMVLGDADYPPLLLHTADPPLLLYLEGRSELLSAPGLGIVGSRRPTPQGRENARAFGAALLRQGWTVVSGLALGIDAAAHEGALQAQAEAAAGADGPGTVAVIGTGIDVAYPLAHKALTRRIAARGLLVSELPLGAPPLAAHFPQRNRLIAGLTRGTLVVEAALRSGSLITARLAAEAGREVFALPGSILSDQSEGCHALIRQGATLVSSVEQVLEDLGPPAAGAGRWPAASTTPADAGAAAGLWPDAPAAAASADESDDPVLRALGHDPASLDALMARCGWPAHSLSAHLLTLELSGQIARLPGGLYQRIQRS
ncbi:DNA-processing protein DprA [Aquabacterium sp. OR-4]|uniref:DNA-processing protein DprA n=1 Tax=Aquabacterium sp. OR-4 TaxID=2978127 RepID=UPI0021B26573|nr:DNA-processing protein DprA [Aquabacterium sp. OR-4]MDT7837433.1 DNA-processing protein DprA [Aquabacterium sp. OR-4]